MSDSVVLEADRIESSAGRSGGPGRVMRWLPAAAVVLLAVVLLGRYDVGFGDMAAFGAYLLAGIAVPGTLLWRVLAPRRTWFVTEAAAGTALGYALEVLTYLPARAAGVPVAVLVWPVATIAAFALVPGLRPYWRGSVGGPPLPWCWVVAGVVAVEFVQSAAQFFRSYGLRGPSSAAPYVDMPYHLALIGEVRHHMPPTIPYVNGLALHYHWFVYADMAATSWVTGVDPVVLLYRLSMMPMMAATTVLIAALAVRISKRVWAGPVALALFFLARVPGPYGWISSLVSDGFNMTVIYLSPTQTFGALLCLPLVYLLVDLLSGESDRRTAWVLVAVLLAAEIGAKATYLPLLVAALCLVIVVRWLIERTLPWSALAALGLTGAAMVFAQTVVYGGASQGLVVAPLAGLAKSGLGKAAGLLQLPPGGLAMPHGRPGAWLFIGFVLVASYVLMWSGAFGVLRARRYADPGIPLVLGIGLAGVAAGFGLAHPAGSQSYFLQSARPYFAILAVAGLAALSPIRVLGERHRGWIAALVIMISGAAVLWTVRGIDGAAPDRPMRILPLALPWLLLLSGLAIAALLIARFGTGHLVVVTLLLVTGASVSAGLARTTIEPLFRATPYPRTIPDGGITAARWLRAHSDPSDLVATDMHCRLVTAGHKCENRHFWLSAYAERRVLVEGWGNTAETSAVAAATGQPHAFVPFWDRHLLRVNDAAFDDPSDATIGRLRIEYGVRWLFVDHAGRSDRSALSRYSTLRFRAGDCAVYQLDR